MSGDDALEKESRKPALEAGEARTTDKIAILSQIKREVSLFAGPLPPPEILAQYERVFSGCSERIVAMAEKQSQHRQALERRVVFSNTRNETVGQIIAGLLGFVGILGGIYLVASDKSVQGFGLIILDLATLVGAFVYARIRQDEERRKKHPDAPAVLPSSRG